MQVEQAEATDMEEIRCSGAPTLEQWYEVRKLTNQDSFVPVRIIIPVLLVMFAGTAALAVTEPEMALGIGPADMTFFFSTLILFVALRDAYYSKKSRNRMVAEKRGLFSEMDWTITNRGIWYEWKSDRGESSGITFWSAFKRTEVTDSFIILYYDSPDEGYNVIFKNWFSSDDDWRCFLDLAKRSIGSQESAGT